MSDKKTYYINKEDCRDIGWAYEIDGRTWDGNLVIENLGKLLIVEGDQRVEGDQIVKGDQRVKGYQIVEGGKAIVGHCRWIVYYTKNKIKIGCKEKTANEWIEFFDKKETFETDVNSLAYNQIYKTFLMAKAAQEVDLGVI